MARTFFTADHHWNHANIIKHAKRPFANADEMNAVMIENWNAVVQPRDTVYHLGDFAMRCSANLMRRIFDALHGYKFLVPGNHDGKRALRLPWAATLAPIVERKIVGKRERRIVMCHYPLRAWNRKARGSWHLHGHSHGKGYKVDLVERGVLDVGVDVCGFTPISWETIERELESREQS